jgi:hypothetical protein
MRGFITAVIGRVRLVVNASGFIEPLDTRLAWHWRFKRHVSARHIIKPLASVVVNYVVGKLNDAAFASVTQQPNIQVAEVINANPRNFETGTGIHCKPLMACLGGQQRDDMTAHFSLQAQTDARFLFFAAFV